MGNVLMPFRKGQLQIGERPGLLGPARMSQEPWKISNRVYAWQGDGAESDQAGRRPALGTHSHRARRGPSAARVAPRSGRRPDAPVTYVADSRQRFLSAVCVRAVRSEELVQDHLPRSQRRRGLVVEEPAGPTPLSRAGRHACPDQSLHVRFETLVAPSVRNAIANRVGMLEAPGSQSRGRFDRVRVAPPGRLCAQRARPGARSHLAIGKRRCPAWVANGRALERWRDEASRRSPRSGAQAAQGSGRYRPAREQRGEKPGPARRR